MEEDNKKKSILPTLALILAGTAVGLAVWQKVAANNAPSRAASDDPLFLPLKRR